MAEQSGDNPFNQPTTTSDVVLVVEGKKLHVSKSVLALVSPVFERMFYGVSKEKNSFEVTLSGKKHTEILEFLLCIYPTTLKPVDRDNVEAVMMLADEYQVQHLLDNCIKYLTNRSNSDYTADFQPSVAEMVHFLHISESNDHLKDVYAHYLDLVSRKHQFSSGKGVKEFSEMSFETRYKVLLRRVKLFDGWHNKTF